MMGNLTHVLGVFVDGCRRLLSVWLLVLALIALCLATTTPAIDDLNTLLSRNFVRQYAIPSFQSAPFSISRIAPYFWTWPFYLAGWSFLLGGILQALMDRRTFWKFLALTFCARYFWRLVRLLFMEVFVTGFLLFSALSLATVLLSGSILARLPVYLFLTVILMGGANIMFMYAVIRTVTEDRRSMIGSIVAAVRFVKRRIGSVVLLSLFNVGVFASGVAVSIWVVRPETINDVPVFLSLLFIARLIAVLTTYAAAVSYFDEQLVQPRHRSVAV